MNALFLNKTLDENPFESMKRTTENGGSYWSARELMPKLGYAKWEHLADLITERVAPAIENQGTSSLSHIAEVGNMVNRSQGGGRPLQDFYLSRLAAYLLAMNGDPRKAEIAAAQHYFAVKTRQSEVVQAPRELTYKEILVAALERETQLENERAARLELTERVQTLEPKAQAYNQVMDAEGSYLVGTVAKILGTGQKALFKLLREKGVLLDGTKVGFERHNMPAQKHVDAKRFLVRARSFEHEEHGELVNRTTTTTYVTPIGLEFIRNLVNNQEQSA